MLQRLAYLGVTYAFALLRLLPMSDRALLAALLHDLPKHVLKHLHLVVRPDNCAAMAP